MHRPPLRTDECIVFSGTPAVMRATTLSPAGPGLRTSPATTPGWRRTSSVGTGASRGPIDYYLDPNEPPGRWWGEGCRAARAGRARSGPSSWPRCFQARHPGEGPTSRPRLSGPQVGPLLPAPPSPCPRAVSVLWALSPDRWVQAEVLAAHDVVVVEMLGSCSSTTVRRLGGEPTAIDQVDTQGLTAALFRQHTSRECRPAAAHPRPRLLPRSKTRPGDGSCSAPASSSSSNGPSVWCTLRSGGSAVVGSPWACPGAYVSEGHADIDGASGDP